MRRATSVIIAATVACGGATPLAVDGGWDATVARDATPDGPGWDGGVQPIESPYLVVDGGAGCDAAPDAKSQVRTCCNDQVCEGLCVTLRDGGGDPFCYCAGSWTGCPPPSVCCNLLLPESLGTCLSACPKLGPP